MHVRVIVDDFYLRTNWGVKKDSVRLVTDVEEFEDGVIRYRIPARILYPCNFTGQIEHIWLKESEVKVKR